MCIRPIKIFLMNDFHYNKMLPYFNKDNLDLLFTDTDSLCYHIKNKDPFEFMLNNKDLFDLSNYDKNHPLYDPTNNKVIGKFKNESPNKQIINFIGLRSKLYSYKTDDKINKRCKGIKKCVVKEIDHTDYDNCLNKREQLTKKQKIFRSEKHKVYTIETTKIALSCTDDKCFLMDNNIDTLTHGHYKLRNYKIIYL